MPTKSESHEPQPATGDIKAPEMRYVAPGGALATPPTPEGRGASESEGEEA